MNKGVIEREPSHVEHRNAHSKDEHATRNLTNATQDQRMGKQLRGFNQLALNRLHHLEQRRGVGRGLQFYKIAGCCLKFISLILNAIEKSVQSFFLIFALLARRIV